MSHAHSEPTRSLPDKPNLTQLRKQAKELLKAYRAGNEAALAECGQFARHPDPAAFSLADAQFVLARAYGFDSWPKLKDFVEGLNLEAFCDAASAGDVDAVLKMAEGRPELVNPDAAEFHSSALHCAVLNRDVNMTRVLMKLGSDARRGFWPYRDATTAFAIATDRGYDDIVETIEQEEERRRQNSSAAGATINSGTDEIQSAIQAGRSDEAIRILEGEVSLIGACNVRGETPLHFSACAHNPQLVAWLLDRQVDVDARDAEGRTPLDQASIVAGWSANDEFFPFLENAQVEPERFDETVQLLQTHGAKLTPRAAVAIGDLKAVREMQREGRLENEIHFYRGGLVAIAVRVNRLDMVSLLLDLGFDPDESATTEDGGRSWGGPLWFAALCGRHEIAEVLLDRGADVNAVVYACGDALCNADATRDERMQALLLEHGARLTVERVAGRKDRETAEAILDGTISAQSLNVEDPSPTDLAEQMLWAAGGSDPGIVRMCLPHMRRELNDPWWAYVLMHATLPESFELILNHGVDPDVAKAGDPTPLHHVATGDVDDHDRLAFAKMLLDAGASFERRDGLLRSTPLGWACRWGQSELVRLYLQRGADAIESDSESWATPLAWARKGGHHEIAELIRAR